MSAFRLAHMSDLHLTPPSRRGLELEPKRWLSRLAWRRKRRRHSSEVLAALVDDLRSQAPDHIAITGDLTNFSTAEEFAAARRWLEALAPSEQVTVSPGNHDALVGARWRQRFAQWAPWLGDEGSSDFPQVRRRGRTALVNLCSAAPTAPFLAQGVLDRAQLDRLRGMLRALRAEGRFRIVILHHPPVPGVVARRKALRRAAELLTVLEAEGAELVLHGHTHEPTMAAAPGPQGPIPVLGVPPASGSPGHSEAARWHMIEIDEIAGEWRTRVIARGLDADGRMAELGRYLLAPVRAAPVSADSASTR